MFSSVVEPAIVKSPVTKFETTVMSVYSEILSKYVPSFFVNGLDTLTSGAVLSTTTVRVFLESPEVLPEVSTAKAMIS